MLKHTLLFRDSIPSLHSAKPGLVHSMTLVLGQLRAFGVSDTLARGLPAFSLHPLGLAPILRLSGTVSCASAVAAAFQAALTTS